MTGRSVPLRFVLAFVLTAAFAFSCLGTLALAGPPEPTLTLTQLQARLDANGGTLPGYMKTVVKGSTISTIPVQVEAITYGPGITYYDMSSLILFKATGPVMDEIGGIADGMSGSPIYVSDGGVDKLVGAVSYGDIFTLGGTGLATPIEYMTAIQSDYAARAGTVAGLSRPVATDGAVKTLVRVVSGSSKSRKAPWDTLVVRPLSAIYVGGIDPSSNMYKAISKRFSTSGMQVLSAPAVGSLESTYDAPFAPGSSLAELASRGDFWLGGVGTVTYVDGSTVVGFGHPMWWSGPSAMFMNNAWIDGVWPSSMEPYKLARPAALRGTITQDRFAGVLGVDGTLPGRMPITARATNLGTGRTAMSTSELTSLIADQPNLVASGYYGLASAAAYIPGGRLFDQSVAKGSATTTTTVRVSDETTIYTITRRNLYSSGYDIPMAAIQDVDTIVGTLQSLNVTETPRAHLLSVDLQTTFSPVRKEARFVDVSVAHGLHTGDNTVRVSYLVNADPTTRTVDIPLHIPAGVPVLGRLTVEPAAGQEYYGWYGWYEPSSSAKSVAEAVNDLSSAPDNSTLKATFKSRGPVAKGVAGTVESSPTPTPYVFSGSMTKVAPYVYARAYPSIVNYRGRAYIYGDCDAGTGTMTVSAKGLATVSFPFRGYGFSYRTPPLKSTTRFTLVPTGPGVLANGGTSVLISVRPPARPEWTRWSNEIVYGSRTRHSARLTAKLSVSKAYAVLTITAPSGTVTLFKGTTGSANTPITFPAWDGLDGHGRRLPTGRYTWTLKLTKKGYTPMTSAGTIHVSRG